MELSGWAAAVAVLLSLSAPLQAQPARLGADRALAEMVAADRSFAQAALDSTAQRAFVRWFAADALIYRPRIVKAADYLRARPMHRGLSMVWEPTFADVSAAGDLGYTTGPWISRRRDIPEADPTFGQYVSVWRRQPDRSWKVELHAGIAHGADAIGPAELRVAPAPEWRGAAAAGAATAPGASDAQAGLLRADAALAEVARERGAAAAFRPRAAPHLRLLRTGELSATGNEALGLLSTIVTYRWQPAGGNVAASGDLGYTYGTFVTITGPAHARVNHRGDYLRIWRRRADGEWRVVLDLTSPLP